VEKALNFSVFNARVASQGQQKMAGYRLTRMKDEFDKLSEDLSLFTP
jgi:hypothetical protein